jgi:hypothetical protein
MPVDRVSRCALLAVVVSLLFGLVTSALPIKVSGKNPRYGYGADSEAYWDHAGNLVSRHAFMSSPGHGFDLLARVDEPSFETQRLPGYPLLLAVVRSLAPSASPRSWPFVLLNLLLVFANGWFVLSICRRDVLACNGPETFPAWIGLVVATYLPFLLYGNGIDSDFLVATLLAGFTYSYLSPGKARWWSPLFAAWAAMTRIGAVVFIVPFLILTLLQPPKRPGRRVLTLVILASVAVCLGGWSYRNYRLSGYFRPEFMSGLVLQQNYLISMEHESPPAGFAGFARWNSDEYRSRRFHEIAATQGYYVAVGQIDAEMKAAAKSLILAHPWRALTICGRNLLALLLRDYFVFLPYRINPSPWTWSVQVVLFLVYYLIPALLFLGAVTAFAFRKSFTTLSILAYSGACYVLVTAVVWGMNARYVLPVEFIIVSVTMYCLNSLRNLRSTRARSGA